jgi:hypothetical protein
LQHRVAICAVQQTTMCHAAQPHSCSQQVTPPASCSISTSHPTSPQCTARGTQYAPSPTLYMADSNKGSHCNLQHQCSPPQWWPARCQHYPSAVHKVLCTGTVATTLQLGTCSSLLHHSCVVLLPWNTGTVCHPTPPAAQLLSSCTSGVSPVLGSPPACPVKL